MRSAADDIVSGIMAKWAAAFSRLDADALSSLYSKNAFFFGSNPKLYRGRDGVRPISTACRAGGSPAVQFTDVATAAAGPDLINIAGTAIVRLSTSAEPLSVKITWVIDPRRRRLEDRQPSRLVEGAVDLATAPSTFPDIPHPFR